MKYVDTCSQYKTETYEAAGKDITLFWLTFQKHWSTSVVEISCSKSFGEFQENLRQWHLALPKLQLSSLLIYCDCTGLRKFFYKFPISTSTSFIKSVSYSIYFLLHWPELKIAIIEASVDSLD